MHHLALLTEAALRPAGPAGQPGAAARWPPWEHCKRLPVHVAAAKGGAGSNSNRSGRGSSDGASGRGRGGRSGGGGGGGGGGNGSGRGSGGRQGASRQGDGGKGRGGGTGNRKGEGGSSGTAAPRKQGPAQAAAAPQLITAPLQEAVLARLAGPEPMPAPWWSTFCGVTNGCWAGTTCAFSPATGEAEAVALDGARRPVLELRTLVVEERAVEGGADAVLRRTLAATSAQELRSQPAVAPPGARAGGVAGPAEAATVAVSEAESAEEGALLEWDEDAIAADEAGLVIFDGGAYSRGPLSIAPPSHNRPRQRAAGGGGGGGSGSGDVQLWPAEGAGSIGDAGGGNGASAQQRAADRQAAGGPAGWSYDEAAEEGEPGSSEEEGDDDEGYAPSFVLAAQADADREGSGGQDGGEDAELDEEEAAALAAAQEAYWEEQEEGERRAATFVVEQCLALGANRRLRLRATLCATAPEEGNAAGELDVELLRVALHAEAWQGTSEMPAPRAAAAAAATSDPAALGSCAPSTATATSNSSSSRGRQGSSSSGGDSRAARGSPGGLAGEWKVFDVETVLIDEADVQTGDVRKVPVYFSQETLQRWAPAPAPGGGAHSGAAAAGEDDTPADGGLLWLPHGALLELRMVPDQAVQAGAGAVGGAATPVARAGGRAQASSGGGSSGGGDNGGATHSIVAYGNGAQSNGAAGPAGRDAQRAAAAAPAQPPRGLAVTFAWEVRPGMVAALSRVYDSAGQLREVRSRSAVRDGWVGGRM